MKSILFVMFFVSPPAEKGHQIWALQSTSVIEFGNSQSCQKAGEAIQDSMKTTDTVKTRAWCFTEDGRRINQFKELGATKSSGSDSGSDSSLQIQKLRPK